jgi:hypothetical protein
MTLSIAGTCEEFFKNLPFQVPDGVFFITDSRITFSSNERYDIGNKIFKLSKYAGFVYSGSVDTTYYIKKHFKQYFTQNELYDIDDIFYIFKKRYLERILNGGSKQVQLLLGFYDKIYNKTKLYKMVADNNSEFIYNQITGIEAIGSNELVREKIKKFDFKNPIQQPPCNLYPINWINYLTTIFKNNVIDEGMDDGIGDPVQTAFIDSKGFHWVSQAVIGRNGNKIIVTSRENDEWKKKSNGIIVKNTQKEFEKWLRE